MWQSVVKAKCGGPVKGASSLSISMLYERTKASFLTEKNLKIRHPKLFRSLGERRRGAKDSDLECLVFWHQD
jgi:hypothetical protein